MGGFVEEFLNSNWLYLVLFLAKFFEVFALVMSSKMLRDDRWILAMGNSWLIGLTQFAFVYIVAQTTDPITTFLVGGIGGSLGCGASHHFYTRIIMK